VMLLALVPAVFGGVTGAADSATPAIPAPPLPAAILPPQLQALEQKMEGLQINSERYSETIRGTALTQSVELKTSTKQIRKHEHGKRISHRKLVAVTIAEFGEVSLSPDQGEVLAGATASRPIEITIGSTIYFYLPTIARRDGGRPWVRFSTAGAASTGASFPYHGQSAEVNAGGKGTYAGLINLLATAGGAVRMIGPVMVNGQQTTEFTAPVEPFTLVRGLSPRQLASLKKHVPAEALDVFLAESGLPVRVIRSIGMGAHAISETTDILSVNIPVHVKRPAARRTISEARLNQLENAKHSSSSENSETGTKEGSVSVPASQRTK
jgi:hypothetical protein